MAHVIVQPVPEAAGQNFRRLGDDDAGQLEIGIDGKWRRFVRAEPGEDQAEIFPGGMGLEPDFVTKRPLVVLIVLGLQRLPHCHVLPNIA